MKNSPHNGPGTPREDGQPAGPPTGPTDMPAGYGSIPYQDPPVNTVSSRT